VKNWIMFFCILGIFVFAGFLCYTQLEIVETTRRIRPSREARQNPYLALERWLFKRGSSVRSLSRGGIETMLTGRGKTVFIETSAFTGSGYDEPYREAYYEKAEEDVPEKNSEKLFSRLTAWIKNGGRLIISIDTYTADWYLASYLKTLGIEEYVYYDEEDDRAETVPDSETGEGADRETVARDLLPDLDMQTRFNITGKSGGVDAISVINRFQQIDSDRARILPDNIIFVYLEIGKGFLAVTGKAYFLHYSYLREAPNAALAAALFPAGADTLIIRRQGSEKHLFGSLAERGNPFPLLAAAIVLLVSGFWMTLPVFGRTRIVPEQPGKPLRERFLAEGRFFFKYGVLDTYLDRYKTELEHVAGSAEAAEPLRDGHQPNAEKNVKGCSLRYFMKRQLHYMEELERAKQSLQEGI
jgi:hypothetical protein